MGVVSAPFGSITGNVKTYVVEFTNRCKKLNTLYKTHFRYEARGERRRKCRVQIEKEHNNHVGLHLRVYFCRTLGPSFSPE